MKRQPKAYANETLGAFFTLLDTNPSEVAYIEGIPYKTIYNLLYNKRQPDGQTLVRLVRALRHIAQKRTAAGKPSLPPEAITCEALLPPINRPLPFKRKGNAPHGTAQRQGGAV